MPAGARGASLVRDLDQDPGSAVAQVHGGRGSAGVPDRIGQAFLHNAVASQLGRVGQRPGQAVDDESGAQSALAGPFDQAGHVVQSRLRAWLIIWLAVSASPIDSVGPPQLPDQSVQLVQTLAGTPLYRRYSCDGCLRISYGRESGGACLHRYGAELVRDD